MPHLRLFDPLGPSSTPTPLCRSKLAAQFINCLMQRGKKQTAERIFRRTLLEIERRVPQANALDVLRQAVRQMQPVIEVRRQAEPVWVGRSRGRALAIRWLIQAARQRRKGASSVQLAEEIVAAYRQDLEPR